MCDMFGEMELVVAIGRARTQRECPWSTGSGKSVTSRGLPIVDRSGGSTRIRAEGRVFPRPGP
jgi:hypothetical protein